MTELNTAIHLCKALEVPYSSANIQAVYNAISHHALEFKKTADQLPRDGERVIGIVVWAEGNFDWLELYLNNDHFIKDKWSSGCEMVFAQDEVPYWAYMKVPAEIEQELENEQNKERDG